MDPQMLQQAQQALSPRFEPFSGSMPPNMVQQALQVLKQRRDAILNSPVGQFGQGYMSQPQQGQPQNQFFQSGQGIGMMPPNTGVGGGDDLLRMLAPLIAGRTSPISKLSKAQGDDVLMQIENALPDIHADQYSSPNTMFDVEELNKIKKLLIKNKETPEDMRKARELLGLHAKGGKK